MWTTRMEDSRSVATDSTSTNYEDELTEILTIHESFAPIAQIKKFDLIKGDVTETLPAFLEANPHLIVAMAVFDMDIYEPTKSALALCASRASPRAPCWYSTNSTAVTSPVRRRR